MKRPGIAKEYYIHSDGEFYTILRRESDNRIIEIRNFEKTVLDVEDIPAFLRGAIRISNVKRTLKAMVSELESNGVLSSYSRLADLSVIK